MQGCLTILVIAQWFPRHFLFSFRLVVKVIPTYTWIIKALSHL